MQRCLSLHLTGKSVTSLGYLTHLCLVRRYTASAEAVSRKHNIKSPSNATGANHFLLPSIQKPPISLQTLGMLLNGPTWPRSKPTKNYGRWSLRLCIRRIRGLVSGLAPEHAVAAVRYVTSAPSLPEQLRPRLLVKASYIFLRHGNFPGALKMYKMMLAEGFSPPVQLIGALYRAAKINTPRKAAKVPTPNYTMNLPNESLGPVNEHLLSLLLSTLEPLQRPELMEDIVQKHIARTSDACFGNPSVVASMIRGYHAANQLNGCYTWFERYRHIWATKNEPIPVAPYACLMVATRRLMPKNMAALYRILKIMQEDKVALTTPIYNEVLASEVRNRRFNRVFSLFIALGSGPSSLQPDAHTLSLVFDALWKNETGPRHESSVDPHYILRQMLYLSHPSVMTIHSSNAALRYFAHMGDFQSATEIVKTMITRHVSPNALTIRWILEEILKRCQLAFTSAASLELEHWARLLLGGLTRDHLAHTSHLLDVVQSTRDDTRCHTVTRATNDALLLIHKTLVSHRTSSMFSTDEQRERLPVLSMIHDLLQVCANPTCIVV
jgi:pentatricopeptide repeat protein